MKAYRLTGPDNGLQLLDTKVVQPTANEVLIQVEACGLCHSDCHVIDGSGASWVKQIPITLGHEVAGTVIGLGEGVSEVQKGDRVAVALVPPACAIGLDYDGGYAKYACAPVSTLVPIPEKVSFEHAAVATDAIVTAYHAVVAEGGVGASTTVAIVGLGGLGAIGLRVAVLQGATVYGFDVDNSKLEAAKKNGAKDCFSSLEMANGINFDVIVDFVGITQTVVDGLSAVRRGGRLVLVGLGAKELTLPTFAIVFNQVVIKGSLGGTKDELATVLNLIADGKIEPVLEEIPFDEVNKGLHRLKEGQVTGRLFTRPRHA
ncbi:putative oxidoreductase [Halenospora varia]|nr:putative oxidoreductase [Halenospora varia]